MGDRKSERTGNGAASSSSSGRVRVKRFRAQTAPYRIPSGSDAMRAGTSGAATMPWTGPVHAWSSSSGV
eukprot:6430281-Pyramimonas_sp.AAC.1